MYQSMGACGSLAGCVGTTVGMYRLVPKCRGSPRLNVGICVYVMGFFVTGCWGHGGMTRGLRCLGPGNHTGDTDMSLAPTPLHFCVL